MILKVSPMSIYIIFLIYFFLSISELQVTLMMATLLSWYRVNTVEFSLVEGETLLLTVKNDLTFIDSVNVL